MGLEPSILGLWVECSTSVLQITTWNWNFQILKLFEGGMVASVGRYRTGQEGLNVTLRVCSKMDRYQPGPYRPNDPATYSSTRA